MVRNLVEKENADRDRVDHRELNGSGLYKQVYTTKNINNENNIINKTFLIKPFRLENTCDLYTGTGDNNTKQRRNLTLFSKQRKFKINDLLSFFFNVYNIIYKKSYFIYIYTVKKIKVIHFVILFSVKKFSGLRL